MAPIPTVQNSSEKRTPTRAIAGSSITGERKSELVTRVKYCNTLPDLPFDTKFLAYPFPSNRFVDYATTSLERNYVYEVLTEPDLGVDVELVIPNAYNLPPNVVPPLDPIDEKLLEDEIVAQKDQKRSRHHAKSVSWLRRTEYISTEQTRFQPQSIDKVEAKVGWSVKKKLKDEMGNYMDRDSQIKSIEKTFEDSQMPIESHFAKPGVTPVEILPVFPDFKLWKYPCAQVIFDSDPAPVGRSVPAQLEEMSQAMIRGVMDESGEQFVAYFLPTEETLEKRKNDTEASREYEDDQVYEYRMAREYNWNVKSKANKGYEENYFFVIRDDGVYYNELETRVRLNKRRVRGPHQQLNTKLCVKHKELEASDYKFQRKRERELEPLGEEDEEEEEETMEVEKSDQSEDERGSAKNNESGDSDNDDAKSEKSVKSDRGRGSDAESNKSNKKSDSEDSDAEGKKSDDDAKSGSYKSDDDAKSPRSDRSSKSKASQRSRSPRKSRSRSKSGSRSRSSSSGSRSGSASGSRSGSGSGSDSGSEKSGGSDKSDASDDEK